MSIAEADWYTPAKSVQAMQSAASASTGEPLGLGDHEVRVLPFVLLGGVRLHAVTEAQSIEFILGELDHGRGGYVVTPNLDHLRRVRHDPSLVPLYRDASLVVADGMPLVWASRLQRTPLPERVAGSSLFLTLSAAAAVKGRSVYLLGGGPGTAPAAAEALKQRYPDLRIAGYHCPEIGFEKDPRQMQRMERLLTAARPDIVYVALGSPKQERLIAKLRSLLPQTWWLGIGISFSFLSGDIQRAPAWMQRNGLEWVHRLFQEPRRLAKRYLVHGMPFAASLLVSAAVSGMIRLVRAGQGQ